MGTVNFRGTLAQELIHT